MRPLLLLEGPPVDDTAEPWRSAPEVRSVASSTRGGRRVLIADDDAAIRAIIARLLDHEGYDVVLARDGSEALQQAFDGGPFDLLITDVRMPVMDGWELSRRLRERWPALPVLYISGFDVELTRTAADEPATGVFLRKPFELDELLRRVAELLGGA